MSRRRQLSSLHRLSRMRRRRDRKLCPLPHPPRRAQHTVRTEPCLHQQGLRLRRIRCPRTRLNLQIEPCQPRSRALLNRPSQRRTTFRRFRHQLPTGRPMAKCESHQQANHNPPSRISRTEEATQRARKLLRSPFPRYQQARAIGRPMARSGFRRRAVRDRQSAHIKRRLWEQPWEKEDVYNIQRAGMYGINHVAEVDTDGSWRFDRAVSTRES